MYETVKPLLFKLEPERAHYVAESVLRSANLFPPLLEWLFRNAFVRHPMLKQECFGTTFYNPVGLAAGFDKNATMIAGTKALGFGYTEIGTVTPIRQAGNPKPRLFRHVAQESLQNAMGFNNDGLFLVKKRLETYFPFPIPVGINIGKNKITPEDEALYDYTKLIRELHTFADYMVINISSPNTPGLRDLQNERFIAELFSRAKTLTDKPILLKIAPDMPTTQAVDLTAMAVEKGADGIIATNTTVDYSLVDCPHDSGGISGKVLREKSFEIFDAVAAELYGKTTLISVGGIDSAEEAYRRIGAGASLVQVLSALIFKGPSLVRDINLGLIELLKQDGFNSITEAIGSKR